MLEAPVEVYWSHVLFDDKLNQFVTTYLRYRRRPHDPLVHVQTSSLLDENIHVSLGASVLRMIVRMSRWRDNSKTDALFTREQWGEIVYEYFVFDVPRIFDICAVFAPNNTDVVRAVLANVFTAQPKYFEDLSQDLKTVAAALVQADVSTHKSETQDAHVVGMNKIEDRILFVWDMLATLNAFLECLPEAWLVFHHSGLLKALVFAYESVLPNIENSLNDWIDEHAPSQSDSDQELFEYLQRTVLTTRSIILRCVGLCIGYGLIAPLYDSYDPHTNRIDEFHWKPNKKERELTWPHDVLTGPDRVDLLCQILDAVSNVSHSDVDIPEFASNNAAIQERGVCLQHVNQLFGISNAIQHISSRNPALDSVRCDYLAMLLGANNPSTNPQSSQQQSSSSSSAPKQTSLSPELLMLTDMFPDWGAGFLSQVLTAFDNNAEQAISALLDDNVPPHLVMVDRQLPFPSATTTTSNIKPQSSPASRPQPPAATKGETSFLSSMSNKGASVAARSKVNAISAEEMRADRAIYERTIEAMYKDEYDDSYEDLVRPDEPTEEEIDLIFDHAPQPRARAREGGQ
eukprot:c20706_g1_i7.p1 GENE.c20706_g1_i7~~c20706_g1_i7.p1  ORF type:complete len:644 (+),score=140.43 c20706_g1_i7:216-1934(+)